MNVVELLKNKGLKKTAQRVLLLNILKTRAVAMTEEDIKIEMGDVYDRITFYRTVQTLIEVGIIHEIVVDNKTIKYALSDICEQGKSHAHFFCKKCRSVTCLSGIPLNTKIESLSGYKVEEYDLLIKGLCNQCA